MTIDELMNEVQQFLDDCDVSSVSGAGTPSATLSRNASRTAAENLEAVARLAYNMADGMDVSTVVGGADASDTGTVVALDGGHTESALLRAPTPVSAPTRVPTPVSAPTRVPTPMLAPTPIRAPTPAAAETLQRARSPLGEARLPGASIFRSHSLRLPTLKRFSLSPPPAASRRVTISSTSAGDIEGGVVAPTPTRPGLLRTFSLNRGGRLGRKEPLADATPHAQSRGKGASDNSTGGRYSMPFEVSSTMLLPSGEASQIQHDASNDEDEDDDNVCMLTPVAEVPDEDAARTRDSAFFSRGSHLMLERYLAQQAGSTLSGSSGMHADTDPYTHVRAASPALGMLRTSSPHAGSPAYTTGYRRPSDYVQDILSGSTLFASASMPSGGDLATWIAGQRMAHVSPEPRSVMSSAPSVDRALSPVPPTVIASAALPVSAPVNGNVSPPTSDTRVVSATSSDPKPHGATTSGGGSTGAGSATKPDKKLGFFSRMAARAGPKDPSKRRPSDPGAATVPLGQLAALH
ncbi:hypothetical protein BC831DRAFT_470386 [Entophlyctis helioformis]|nr:hypothetical protein BC831DRAFT_470386 [Entophlyctis helioformis]